MHIKQIHLSTERRYRNSSFQQNEEQQLYVQIEESDLFVLLTNKISEKDALDFFSKILHKIRNEIELYSIKNQDFIKSLTPLDISSTQSNIINDMLIAGKTLDVGPFAAVAGSVAEYVAKAGHEFLLSQNLPSDILVENGGDVYLISSKERLVGLLDKPEEECVLGIKIKPTNGLSICTSSATIGHSLSFGRAELMTVLANKGSIADAAATSYCNMIQNSADFQKVLERNSKLDCGIIGLVGSCDNELFAYGDIELALI